MRQCFLHIIILVVVSLQGVLGQTNAENENQKRLVYFTDKSNSPYSLQKPLQFLSQKALERRQRQKISLISRDLPVNPSYVAGIKEQGVEVWYTSRWFNAAVVQCNNEQLVALQALPYVSATTTLNRSAVTPPEVLTVPQKLELLTTSSSMLSTVPEADYGRAFHQANMLGAVDLHKAGYKGAGMLIAVLDAGFPGVQSIEAFSHLFQRNKIKGTYDFVQRQEDVFGANSHGTAVLSTMAAYEPGKMIGTAYEADYLLLRTEDAATEHNIEEINWLLAAEYADSAGADVINTSLGYTTFDSPSKSYTYNDLDGNTTLVAKAADYAAASGMLLVVSAGNEGNNSWRYVGSPADADSVLAVGAVDSLGIKASFSSFGPSADGQIKPDVVAMGQRVYVLSTSGTVAKTNGTSFSGPIVAGFAASLWQANRHKTNFEMIKLLRQIGNNAAAPDNNIGYGIPNYSRYLVLAGPLPKEEDVYITNPVYHSPIILTLGLKWVQQPVEVQVFDATGKVVYQQVLQNAQQEQELKLTAGSLKNGLYLCRVRAGKMLSTVRFVKI
ncbi:S8 family serine peptidase [Pontibacter locisalis]|uniref:S8 family serine peptidase n=1 Tax=Pontibacter locisalis TaxID=1719035 RepID=A0ABW5IQZ0_9BACT